jgi:hypothetical protein
MGEGRIEIVLDRASAATVGESVRSYGENHSECTITVIRPVVLKVSDVCSAIQSITRDITFALKTATS